MVCHRVMVKRALFLFLTLSFAYVQGQEVVQLDQNIHGTSMTTRKGRQISAYLGIPYAEPPIGSLRFQNPIPWNRWDGPMTADKYADQCPQINNDGVVVGDEDCLYLNVYTPKINQDTSYPVMVYFHGGDFVRGSSEEAGPEYLLDKDIVLVTVNYRLGVLGFLSTGDAAAPGNFGLKDQTLALAWVRTNILAFGGHPQRVTIFGQDSGGVSTVLLAMSWNSRDLFDKYIAQSGSPMAFWAFTFDESYKKYATYLGDYLKCPTGESFALVECLRSLEPYALVDSNDIFNDNIMWQYRTWAPTNEPKALAGTFVVEGPIESALFVPDWIKDCPAILGTVSDEGLVMVAELYANNTMYDSISKNLDGFLRALANVTWGDENGKAARTAEKIKKFYFKSDDLTDKETFIRNMTNLMTDIAFKFPMGLLQALTSLSLKSPYYMYNFDYRGSYSETSEIIGNNANVGVCHGDDLSYLFPIKNATIQLSDSDEKMIDIMTDFWTSFAYNGAPTSQYISEPNIWKPSMSEQEFLAIGHDSDPLTMSLGSLLEDKGYAFWNRISVGGYK